MLLVAINAKYVHTCLSVRYLKSLTDGVNFVEYSINETAESIAMDIFRHNDKLLGFSCYIWNIELIKDVADILKKADPCFEILLGGPEVSYNSVSVLKENKNFDYVIKGEGEKAFLEFLAAHGERKFDTVSSFVYRENNNILETPQGELMELSDIPFPYSEDELKGLKNRIIYYETSRGCPYNCAFCLSSSTKGVRFLPVDRVKAELLKFIDLEIPLIKLVDRTFNADNKRALEIVEFIKQYSKNTCFHFEIKAETVSNDLLLSLKTAKKGMFQLEIGVQSTNCDTLKAINRIYDLDRLSYITSELKENNNIHLHLDLIAGLPFESYEIFKRSFNDIFALKPHDLQLGFLKRLKGAEIKTYNSKFTEKPPYEVIKTDWLSYDEIIKLKEIAFVLEKYYNSGFFMHCINKILLSFSSPFDFFESLACFFRANDYMACSHSMRSLFEILKNFIDEYKINAVDELIIDFCLTDKGRLSFMSSGAELKSIAFEFLKNEKNIAEYLPQFIGEKPANIYKSVRFYSLTDKIVLFDYDYKTYYNITCRINGSGGNL